VDAKERGDPKTRGDSDMDVDRAVVVFSLAAGLFLKNYSNRPQNLLDRPHYACQRPQ